MLKELESKYLNNQLNDEESIMFLTFLRENQDAPFRERRITKLERLISSKIKMNVSKTHLEQKQHNAAREYVDLTRKWEGLGAYWNCYEKVLTKWFYNEKCFFSWISGVDVIDNLEAAKKADIELEKLIILSE